MKNTERFSNRADHYAKYRPSYPREILAILREAGLLHDSSVVADVGSGTGKWTEILLETGAKVMAVEPNEPMRQQAEALLGGNPNFTSAAGSAEATGLADHSVDLVTAAQAFHWFDVPAAKREFRRILRTGGGVALIWNDRALTPGFMTDLHELLRKHSAEYRSRPYPQISMDAIGEFFSPAGFITSRLPYEQPMDLRALKGRVLSSSYIPMEPAGLRAIEADLEQLFARHQKDGQVVMEYFTEMFHGKIS